jgi:hypothetical protein
MTFIEQPVIQEISPVTFDGGADIMQLYWKATNSLWTSVPREIKERILSYFHSKEIVKTLTVSKDWNNMVNQSTTIWRNLCNREYPQIPNSTSVEDWKTEFRLKTFTYLLDRHSFQQMHSIRMAQRHWMMCGVHMFHPVNGRRGFDLVPPPPNSDQKPPLETMIKMLHREEELRLSDPIQKRFADPSVDTIHVAADVQLQVVREFGFNDDMVDMIRAAPALYPTCPEVRRIPHYQKFNRAREGHLISGSPVPNCPISLLNGTTTTLFDYFNHHFDTTKPILIAAGSYT